MARLRIRELRLGDTLCIRVVESIDVRHVSSDSGKRVFARLEPVAVIVCDADAVQTFDMTAGATEFAGLSVLVAEFAGGQDFRSP